MGFFRSDYVMKVLFLGWDLYFVREFLENYLSFLFLLLWRDIDLFCLEDMGIRDYFGNKVKFFLVVEFLVF